MRDTKRNSFVAESLYAQQRCMPARPVLLHRDELDQSLLEACATCIPASFPGAKWSGGLGTQHLTRLLPGHSLSSCVPAVQSSDHLHAPAPRSHDSPMYELSAAHSCTSQAMMQTVVFVCLVHTDLAVFAVE